MMPSIDMMMQCASNVAPATTAAIIRVESGGNANAVGINGWHGPRSHPKTASEAARIARFYISRGYSVDLGLMQINSQNLPGLGYTVEQILEPCNNLRAGSRILSRGYAGAVKHFGQGQGALRAALSAYNTGNYERGFRNGYVAKYYPSKHVRIVVQATSVKPLINKPTQDIYSADSTIYSLLQ